MFSRGASGAGGVFAQAACVALVDHLLGDFGGEGGPIHVLENLCEFPDAELDAIVLVQVAHGRADRNVSNRSEEMIPLLVEGAEHLK